MSLSSQIIEESARFIAFYGRRPDCVFIGVKQQEEIDAMIEGLATFGLYSKTAPKMRATICGLPIYRVDAESHLSFGLDQPSPCG